MRYFKLVLILLLFTVTTNAQKVMGFTDANATRQLDWEKQFDAQLNAKNQDGWMQFLTSAAVLCRLLSCRPPVGVNTHRRFFVDRNL